MANKFQTKRTTISGRTPNTTNSGNTHYIDAGELALNLTDGKMFSSNGSVYFEVGANVQNLSVTGNATIKAIIANGSIGSNGNILASNGSAIYWATSGNAVFSRSVTTYTANGTANSFVVTGGYIEEQLDVYVNGVRYNSADYYANDTVNVGLIDTPGSGDTVELISYIGGSSGSGTVTQVNTGIGLSGGPITNTGTIQVIANNGIIANSTGIFANAGTGIVANATGIHVNSSYIATISANNSSFLGGTAAASFVQNTDSRTLSGNLVISGTSFTPSANTILLGNSTQRWVVSANTIDASGVITGTSANLSTSVNSASLTVGTSFIANSTQLTLTGIPLSANGSTGTAGQVLHSNGTTGSPYWAADDNSGGVTQVSTGNGLSGGPITTTGTIDVVANSGIVANATGIHVNSSYIATISANNTSFLDGVAAASYVQNTDSRTLSGNLVISGTSFTPSSNTVLLGNTTQRWVLSANTGSFSGAVSGITTLAAGNTTITGFANVSSTIQGGSSLIIAGALSGVTTADMGNTTITGFANVTSTIQGGSSLTIAGAASGITTLAAGNTTITGFANASVSVNSALLTVGTSFIANTTGVYHTGLVNAASINIGSSGFIANSTAIVLGEPVTANGTTGTSGQVLASNGTVGTPYWTTVAAGGTVTVTDDTATNGTRYIAFANQTSGNLSSVFVDSTGLTFNPSTGTVTAAIFSATSDERLKSDIQAVVNPIEKIKSINGVNFTYKASNTRSMGVIAQEVEKQMPELVNMNSEGYRQVNYNGIIGVLVEAVKQQQQQITYLNNQIDILRSDK